MMHGGEHMVKKMLVVKTKGSMPGMPSRVEAGGKKSGKKLTKKGRRSA